MSVDFRADSVCGIKAVRSVELSTTAVCRRWCCRTLTLRTIWSEPAQIAVALAPRQRRALRVDAPALPAAVLIRCALVPVLATRAVVVAVAFAVVAEVLALAGAGLAVLFACRGTKWNNGQTTVEPTETTTTTKRPIGAMTYAPECPRRRTTRSDSCSTTRPPGAAGASCSCRT